MTYENCLKYRDEADNDKDRDFWDKRAKKRAILNGIEVVAKEKKVAQKPSKAKKKAIKEVDNGNN